MYEYSKFFLLCFIKPKYWSANWKGLEMSKYFDIDCVFPVDSILNFINISDERKISLIWKSGVLIEENLANILLESAENKYCKPKKI